MDFSALLASFAAAFSLQPRLLSLPPDGGQIAAERLLFHTLDGSEGVSEAIAIRSPVCRPTARMLKAKPNY